MTLQVDSAQLSKFFPQLLRTLDSLGLLPLHLWAKPTEFEKYPRLLLGSIERYNDPEAGFREWASRVLRDAPYRKEEHYQDIERLKRWMVENAGLFKSKANVQHLRTSLYERVFEYLYPRRVLANAYCAAHEGNPLMVESDLLATAFPGSAHTSVQKLKDLYEEEDWETIVNDTRTSLAANAAYYRKVLRGKDTGKTGAATTPAIDQQTAHK